MALQAAGNAMLGDPYAKQWSAVPNPSMLGVRALREDYMKPAARADVPRNLRLAEERYARDAEVLPQVASEERLDLPRFQHLFVGGELLPASVFLSALELGPAEQLNGQAMPFDADVLILRDSLVLAYKPLVFKIRQMNSKEIPDIPIRPVSAFTTAWTAFESAWLRSCEAHAVQALQPLAKAILSLEPLLLSLDKERLLPWPRVQHQKVVSLKCLEGFMQSFSELAACVLPSLARELDHDPKLLLLMDHVLSLRGEKATASCLDGVSATPHVSFNTHEVRQPGELNRNPSAGAPARDPKGGGMPLDAYAFRLLGASVGDAVAAGMLKPESGNGQAGRAKLTMAGTLREISGLRGPAVSHETAAGGVRESKLSRKSAVHAEDLLHAFESIKDLLLSLKSTLEHIDPALDRDRGLVSQFARFEQAFKRAKRLCLEPDNLA